MTKNQKIALGIWLFLLAQTAFLMRYPEPYPSFALPGFGLSTELFQQLKKDSSQANSEQSASAKLLVVTQNLDTINLHQTPILSNISEYHQKYLIRKLILRHSQQLKKADYNFLKYALYRSNFSPTQAQKLQFTQRMQSELNIKPKCLILKSSINHIRVLEVFE